jgi:hypothetical protein
MSDKYPTGAKMIQRTIKVKDRVKEILLDYPSTKGNDTLLIYRYLRRFHPNVKLTANQFKEMLRIPSFETVRRRRQEWQGKNEEGQPLYPELCPTERVTRKRKIRAEAMSHDHGRGLTLKDFETWGD